MITYAKDGEWAGYSLAERADGTWRYEGWCRIQGCNSGRVAIIQPPPEIVIIDEADLDTQMPGDDRYTKAEYLKLFGAEVRCLRRGHTIT